MLVGSRGMNVATTRQEPPGDGVQRDEEKEKARGWLLVTERRLISLAAPRQTTEAVLPSQTSEHTLEKQRQKRHQGILNIWDAPVNPATDIRERSL